MWAHTILAVVTGESGDRAVLDAALAVAAPDAVEIIALYVRSDPRNIIPLLDDGLTGAMASELIEVVERQASARATEARTSLDQWSRERNLLVQSMPAQSAAARIVIWRELVGREDDAAAFLGRNADIIVIARQADGATEATIEACLFNSGRPVLLAPAAPSTTLGGHVGIFWDGSCQAARAVGDAMPLLRKAQRVTVYTTGAEGSAPAAGELARRLSRTGITTLVDLVSTGLKPVAEPLLSAAERDGVDLIVMGGYGHGRFREMMLGGVTRVVIDSGQTAVLMSH